MTLLLSLSSRKRKGFAAGLAVGVFVIVIMVLWKADVIQPPFFNLDIWNTGTIAIVSDPLFYIFIAVMFVIVTLSFKCSWVTALFCLIAAHSAQQLFLGVSSLISMGAEFSQTASRIIQMIMAACVTVLLVAVFRKKLSKQNLDALETRHGISLVLLLVLAIVMSESSVHAILSLYRVIPQLSNDTFTQLTGSAALLSIWTNIIGNVIVLFALYFMLQYSETDLNEELFSKLYEQERAQYEQFRQNVDYINARYHDLRHCLTLLSRDKRGAKQLLDQVSENIAFLETEIDTGNETLNNIITDRRMLCHNKNIDFHFMTDGTAFEWIDSIDLYLIFCNILDNAIEYLETAPGDRIITLGIKTIGQMTFIHQDNSLLEELSISGNIPVSTKGDPRNHGFGIKSISTTVERYGGRTTVSAEGGKFQIDIFLPHSAVY